MNDTPNFATLDEMTARLRDLPIQSGPPESVAQRAIAAMRSADAQPGAKSISFALPRRVGQAIAAMILIGLGIATIFRFSGPGEIAFAQVAAQVAQTHSVSASLQFFVLDAGKQPVTARFFVKGSRMRFEGPGTVMIRDQASGQHLLLQTDLHVADQGTGKTAGAPGVDLYGDLRDMQSSATTPLGQKVFGDKTLTGFSGIKESKDDEGKVFRQPVNVWVDPASKLPARVEYFDGAGHLEAALQAIRFDVPLEDALFDMQVPSGYRVQPEEMNIATSQPASAPAITTAPWHGDGKTLSIACESDTTVNGKPVHQSTHLFIKGTRERAEVQGFLMRVSDRQTGQALTIFPSLKSANPGIQKINLIDDYALIHDLDRTTLSAIGEKAFDGQRLLGFTGVIRLPVLGLLQRGKPTPQPANVWFDPATNLPRRIELRDKAGGATKATWDIHFDLPLDDALFDLTPPQGLSVSDQGGLTRAQLKPPATAQEAAALVLRPGSGIADLHFGASRENVVATLGKPEQILYDTLAYPSRGFSLYVNLKTGLSNIDAFSADAVDTNALDFPGKTDNGLHIGSTAREVADLYGPPDSSPGGLPAEFGLQYKKLGLRILFANGVVTRFMLSAVPIKPTARDAEALMLKPNVGIGNLPFGAGYDQIIAAYGPPESTTRNGPGTELNYSSRGVSFILAPIIGLAGIQTSTLFPGKTDKGIGFGSTVKEVEAAYGRPDASPTTQPSNTMTYRKFGMTIFQQDGNVTQIWMIMQPPAFMLPATRPTP
jgi:outer membrane lipoprotein-sorting protein